MNRIPHCVAAFVLAFVCVPAYALSAAGQGVRSRGTEPVAGRAVPRGESPRPEVQSQAEPQRATAPVQPAAAPRVPPTRQIEVPRQTAVPRSVPRVLTPAPPVIESRIDGGRRDDHPAYRPDYRSDYRPQYRPDYRSHYYSGYRPSYRPYYTFRPRVSLGFGLWMGYPVTYPHYAYGYPYSYPYPSAQPYPYTYSSSVSIYSAPGTAMVAASGGLSFDIRPTQSSVYVDGQFVGLVSQFSPDLPPLWLLPGRHHVQILEPGFEAVAFDVDIIPGQVIPYHGDLRRF